MAIYKQMILPMIDDAGFLLICCRLGDKADLQKMQNDILRICCGSRIADRVSIESCIINVSYLAWNNECVSKY